MSWWLNETPVIPESLVQYVTSMEGHSYALKSIFVDYCLKAIFSLYKRFTLLTPHSMLMTCYIYERLPCDVFLWIYLAVVMGETNFSKLWINWTNCFAKRFSFEAFKTAHASDTGWSNSCKSNETKAKHLRSN